MTVIPLVTSPTLDADERESLVRCEDVIERGLKSYIEVGEALDEVRDRRLYRETYNRFDDYLRERWGLGKSHAYRLINAAKQAVEIRAVSPRGEAPRTEAQSRHLLRIESLNARDKAVQRIEEAGGWGKVSAPEVGRICDEEIAAWRWQQTRHECTGSLGELQRVVSGLQQAFWLDKLTDDEFETLGRLVAGLAAAVDFEAERRAFVSAQLLSEPCTRRPLRAGAAP